MPHGQPWSQCFNPSTHTHYTFTVYQPYTNTNTQAIFNSFVSTRSTKCIIRPTPYTPSFTISHPRETLWGIKDTHSTFCLSARKKTPQCNPISSCWMVWSWCLKQLSHHQTCVTGVSSILWYRVLPRWCGCTCPWCPHTQTQSDLLHRTSVTQISSKHKEWTIITSPLLVFIHLTFQRKMFFFYYYYYFFYLILFSVIVWNKQVTDRYKSEWWRETFVSVEFSRFYSSEMRDWMNVTNFCMMGSRRSRPGWISLSGLVVSAIVLTVAMYTPSAATLWE